MSWIATIVIFLVLIIIMAILRSVDHKCINVVGGSQHTNNFPKKVVTWSHHVTNSPDYGLLEMAPHNNVTMYSSLMPWHVSSVQKTLQDIFKDPPKTIADATTHIGADSANFLRTFPKAQLTAIEIDPKVSAVALRNLSKEAIIVNAPKPTVITGDGAAYIKTGEPTDLLYLDPPWGGANATQRVLTDTKPQWLWLGGIEVTELVKLALKRGFGTVLIKLPRESDTNEFCQQVCGNCNSITCRAYPIYDMRYSQKLSYWLVAVKYSV